MELKNQELSKGRQSWLSKKDCDTAGQAQIRVALFFRGGLTHERHAPLMQGHLEKPSDVINMI